MLTIFRRLWRFFGVNLGFLSLSSPLPPPLDDLTVSIFIRQPNGSRTDLEHYLEQEFSARGARVVLTDQKAGMELLREGRVAPLAEGVDLVLVGTLVFEGGLWLKVANESQYDFLVRESEYAAELADWNNRWGRNFNDPKPVAPIRRQEVSVPVTNFKLSFRIVGRDSTILTSGVVEDSKETGDFSYDEVFTSISTKVVEYLDDVDLWHKIIIR